MLEVCGGSVDVGVGGLSSVIVCVGAGGWCGVSGCVGGVNSVRSVSV